jgi:hypothetical protein
LVRATCARRRLSAARARVESLAHSPRARFVLSLAQAACSSTAASSAPFATKRGGESGACVCASWQSLARVSAHSSLRSERRAERPEAKGNVLARFVGAAGARASAEKVCVVLNQGK